MTDTHLSRLRPLPINFEIRDVSLLYDSRAPRGAAAVGKRQPVCRADNRRDVSGILKRREALWLCVQVVGAEPTNNAAERSIRPGVLWCKGSFGTQSEADSRFVESRLTVVSTL